MEAAIIQRCDDELFETLDTVEPPILVAHGEAGVAIADVYAIQERMIVGRSVIEGACLLARMICVASKNLMEMLGVDQFDFGRLLLRVGRDGEWWTRIYQHTLCVRS